jgi:hypothetical protein
MRLRKTLTFLTLATALVFALSAWAQQRNVAPTFRSARADLKVSATTATSSPAKPFTQDQVQGLVRDGLGDESGAKLIEQRGIDFAPAEDFLQSLKAAGASEAFLKAVRAAKQPEAASAKKPLNQVQVFALLAGQVTSPPRGDAGGPAGHRLRATAGSYGQRSSDRGFFPRWRRYRLLE